MPGGYMGRLLWVDLATETLAVETPAEDLLRDFVGGYGLGARLLYDRMPAHADPLGPNNILGFLTGPFTGTPAPTGNRWVVVGKSPLTGSWGDSNGGGDFGPALKRAGFDGVFFTGIACRPVYLYLQDGRAELRDASGQWGRDCYQVEDWVKETFGHDAEVACIGPAGEQRSLIAAVLHRQGRAAARSGLAAVMGAKRLKMVVAQGSAPVPLADLAGVRALKRKYLKQVTGGFGFSTSYRTSGTPGYTPQGVVNGDSPTRNWGASVTAFPDPEPLDFQHLLKMRVKREACWECPLACWGTSRADYQGEQVLAHQPEYETASAFGSMALNNNYPSLVKVNEICNRYGLDTISAGACVAFAIECYEHGLIDSRDTGGLELAWGDHQAIVALTEKIALRQDIGALLADGVMRAAERLGPASEPFAVHVGGQELPMHDPRFEPGLGIVYKIDATPGRHTQAGQFGVAAGFPREMLSWGTQRERQQGRGGMLKDAACLCHTMNAAGMCLFGYYSVDVSFMAEFLAAITGRATTLDDVLTIGERIANIRQAFNVREGINAVALPVPARAYGRPPLPDGPTAGITVEIDQMLQEHLDNMGWTADAAVPRRAVLERLGLADVAADLWPAVRAT